MTTSVSLGESDVDLCPTRRSERHLYRPLNALDWTASKVIAG